MELSGLLEIHGLASYSQYMEDEMVDGEALMCVKSDEGEFGSYPAPAPSYPRSCSCSCSYSYCVRYHTC